MIVRTVFLKIRYRMTAMKQYSVQEAFEKEDSVPANPEENGRGPEGIVFDIKQMAVFDGPGLRTTVFLKGCPLRCRWCHNPEGLSAAPQLMVSDSGCLHCGRCEQVCPSPGHCRHCGRCVRACPLHLRRIAGTGWFAEDLADHLLKDAEIFRMNGGGVTFSGGEPTMQGDFLIAVLSRLGGVHKAIETCGYCSTDLFGRVLSHLDYVLMDLKLADSDLHREWTGKPNELILENLRQLKECGIPFTIRIPLIPGVTDTQENLSAAAGLLEGCAFLERVELLPYHKTAGAKYAMVRQTYSPGFDSGKAVRADTAPFERAGIPVRVL